MELFVALFISIARSGGKAAMTGLLSILALAGAVPTVNR
jgi:hypothetical protein